MHSITNTELSSLEETRRQFNGGRCAIKMGVDVHQDFYVVVEQVGGTNPKPPQRFHKQAFPALGGKAQAKWSRSARALRSVRVWFHAACIGQAYAPDRTVLILRL